MLETPILKSRVHGTICLLCLIYSAVSWSDNVPGRADFDCKTRLDNLSDELELAAITLAQDTFDLSKLECASKAFKSIADANRESLAAQLNALRVYSEYMFYLNQDALHGLSYIVEEMHNVETLSVERLKKAKPEFNAILQRAITLEPHNPEVILMQASTLGITPEALELLESIIKVDPYGLNGAAHALLGEVLYGLPDLAGGSLEQAIQHLMQAVEINTGDPRSIRLLGRVYEELGNNQRAVEVLTMLETLQPGRSKLQAMADELQNAAQLSARMKAEDLASRLHARRDQLLSAHPYLMKRQSTSLLMHGGETHPVDAWREKKKP